MSKLYVISKFKLHPGKQDEFKQAAADLLNIVKEKDPGTSQYEWFASADETEFTVLEAYADSEAVLAHLANLGENLGKIMALGDFSAEVLGTPSSEVMTAVQGLSLQLQPTYVQGLN